MPLLQFLATLTLNNTNSKKSSLAKSKSRSHSVPHFNQLKFPPNAAATTATEKDHDPSTSAASNSEESTLPSQTTLAAEPASSQLDSNSLDNRSINSSSDQAVEDNATAVNDDDAELAVTMSEDQVQATELLISPISDLDVLENITDDEKRRLHATTSKGSSLNVKNFNTGY